MKFVSVRELRIQTPDVLKRVARGEKVIVTKRGKPQAALVKLTEDDIDDLILSQPHFLEELDAAKQEYEEEGGLSLQQAKELLAD